MSRSPIVFPRLADVLLTIPDHQLRVLGCILIDPAKPPALAGYRGLPREDSVWFIGSHFVYADAREVTIETLPEPGPPNPVCPELTRIIPVDLDVAIEFALMKYEDPAAWCSSPTESQPAGHVHVLKPGEVALLLSTGATIGVKLTWGPRAG